MRLHGVKFLFQMHEPCRSQVDVLQHHPPVRPQRWGCDNKSRCSENTEHATYLPDLTAVLMSLSALLKPSAEPVNSGKAQSFNYNSLTKLQMVFSYCFHTNRDGGDLPVLLSSKISDQAAGIITWHRAHQHWSAGLYLQPGVKMENVSNVSTLMRVNTSRG